VQKSSRASAYPRARPDLTFRPSNGQFTLNDRAGAQADRLSLVAAVIWTYCDGRHAPDAIAEAIARELPEAGNDVPARVASVLARFSSQGMLS
jgi:hypothetical protein